MICYGPIRPAAYWTRGISIRHTAKRDTQARSVITRKRPSVLIYRVSRCGPSPPFSLVKFDFLDLLFDFYFDLSSEEHLLLVRFQMTSVSQLHKNWASMVCLFEIEGSKMWFVTICDSVHGHLMEWDQFFNAGAAVRWDDIFSNMVRIPLQCKFPCNMSQYKKRDNWLVLLGLTGVVKMKSTARLSLEITVSSGRDRKPGCSSSK